MTGAHDSISDPAGPPRGPAPESAPAEPARARLTRTPGTDLIFDPDDPWFADAPLVAIRGGTLQVLRGTLTTRETEEVTRQLGGGDTDTPAGVLTNPLGAVTLAWPGQYLGHDPRDVHTLDESALLYDETLGEVAARLREIAAFLEHADATGWTLNGIYDEGLIMTVAPERVTAGWTWERPYPDYAKGADLTALAERGPDADTDEEPDHRRTRPHGQ